MFQKVNRKENGDDYSDHIQDHGEIHDEEGLSTLSNIMPLIMMMKMFQPQG